MLLSLPLMSDKTVDLIASSMRAYGGLLGLEACYELDVIILTYDGSKVDSEERLLAMLRSIELNSPVEQKHATDIPVIRSRYEITQVFISQASPH